MISTNHEVCETDDIFRVSSNSSLHSRSAISNKYIQCGQIVCSNRAYAWNLRYQYLSSHCSSCFRSSASLHPLSQCSKCKKSKYCNRECQLLDHPQHSSCCKFLRDEDIQLPDKDIVDDILLIIKVLHINKKLKQFDCVKYGKLGISCGLNHFKELAIGGGCYDSKLVQTISEVLRLTQSNNIELVTDTLAKFRSNNFGITDSLMNCIGMGVYPRAALLNHSCYPNCLIRFECNSTVSRSTFAPVLEIVALRDIQENEEFTHSYVDCTQTHRIRQEKLFDVYGFKCNCSLCQCFKAYDNADHLQLYNDIKRKLNDLMTSPLQLNDYINSVCREIGVIRFRSLVDTLQSEVVKVRIIIQ